MAVESTYAFEGPAGRASLLDSPDKKWVEVSDAGEAAFRKQDASTSHDPGLFQRVRRAGGPRNAAALRAADWLALAASPIFAIMALLTGVLRGGPAEMLCSAAHGAPLSGMATMYLLMSAFHAGPWLRLIGASARE